MRQDQWRITLTIDGVDCGEWDTFAGGDVTASETKYKPGSMGPEKSLGGSKSVGNITVGRLLDQHGPDWELCRTLMQKSVGRHTGVVGRQPLDEDGNAFGKPMIYRGKVNSVTAGDTDSNADGAQVWTVVVSTEGQVS